MTLAVITFGRFQPPTVGHFRLLELVESVAKNMNGIPLAFVSHTVDARHNPIPYDDRVSLLRIRFPFVVNDTSKDFKNIFDVMKKVGDTHGISRVVVVSGPDRSSEYQEKLLKYNNIEYNYKSIEFVNLEDRQGISGTDMRFLARTGSITQFKSKFFTGASDDVIMSMYRQIQSC